MALKISISVGPMPDLKREIDGGETSTPPDFSGNVDGGNAAQPPAIDGGGA